MATFLTLYSCILRDDWDNEGPIKKESGRDNPSGNAGGWGGWDDSRDDEFDDFHRGAPNKNGGDLNGKSDSTRTGEGFL